MEKKKVFSRVSHLEHKKYKFVMFQCLPQNNGLHKVLKLQSSWI